jgi:hypothetical protein
MAIGREESHTRQSTPAAHGRKAIGEKNGAAECLTSGYNLNTSSSF